MKQGTRKKLIKMLNEKVEALKEADKEAPSGYRCNGVIAIGKIVCKLYASRKTRNECFINQDLAYSKGLPALKVYGKFNTILDGKRVYVVVSERAKPCRRIGNTNHERLWKVSDMYKESGMYLYDDLTFNFGYIKNRPVLLDFDAEMFCA